MRLRSFLLPVVLVLGIWGCFVTEFDHFFTFNVDKNLSFVLPQATSAGKDTTLTIPLGFDTTIYQQQHTRSDLLGTSYLTKFRLSTNAELFPLRNFQNMRLLLGSDTVGTVGDSVLGMAWDTLSLTLRHVDITKYLKDSSGQFLLQARLKVSPPVNIPMGAALTITQTAKPVAN